MSLELRNRYPYNYTNISILLNHLSSICGGDELLITDVDIQSNIKSIYSIRHDLFQSLVCEQLGLTAVLGVGATIAEQLGLEYDHSLRFTPDITVKIGGSYVFLDPGISITPTLYAIKKKEKYSAAIRKLVELGFDATFKAICIHPNLMNTELYVDDFIPWPPEDSRYSDLHNWFDSCQKEVLKLRMMLKYDYTNSEDWLSTDHTDFCKAEDYINVVKDLEITQALSQHKYTDYETFKETFYKLADDPDVQTVLEDKPVDPECYKEEFIKAMSKANHSTNSAKPSFHIAHAPWENIGGDEHDLPEDQSNCLNILTKFSRLNEDSPELSLVRFLRESLIQAISHKADRNMFITNSYTGDAEEDLRLKSMHPKGTPYREFLQKKGLDVSPERPVVTKGRVLGVPKLPGAAFVFQSKSGVQYNKNHPYRKYEKPIDCLENSYEIFQSFYDMVCTPSENSKKIDPFFDIPPGPDSESANRIKLFALSEFKHFFGQVSKAPIYEMLRCVSLTAKSLIHFNHMKTKSTDYTLINVGLPNVMHIVQGGSQNRGSDLGNPFFSLVITSNKDWVTSLFGNHIVWSVNGIYYVIYSWRRLQCNRLSFISDGYYSTLSTGFDTFLRNKYRSMGVERIKKTYGFRSLVVQCTTQKLAEFLMDIRYLSMSFISKYSDVAGLISEKFSPRYPNSFCYWVIKNLYNKCDQLIESYNTPGGILMRHAYYVNDKRRADTTGGTISIKSIWCDEPVYSLQDLFDELFVYVHTIKEPASNFHEFRKCLETINVYQRSFEMMEQNHRNGIYSDFLSLKNWIIGKNLKPGQKIMGCWVDACYHAAKDNAPSPSLNGRIRSSMNSEPLSEIISTKACIPEYTYKEEESTVKKRKADNTEEIKRYLLESGLEVEAYKPKIRLLLGVKEGSIINPMKLSGRAKVIDCICDFKDRFPLTRTVLDLANWNIFSNSGRVVADICIKAQYGAKREFYVMNLGAKSMLRVFENCFKEIAKDMREEMISVPGDGKLKFMSEISDESTKWTPDKSYLQLFVNGDCSKWSASETMASFWGMVDGLCIPEAVKPYLRCVLALWTDKKINYPLELLQGTRFITKMTEYLNEGTSKKSTQNFLQGMFNYSSSVKAVLATRMSIKLWDERYGRERMISVRHLEHSDDYVLVVRCQSYRDFLDFRIYHKLMQRLVGITDSSKKTNCQHYIMEFISLMSFNGQMSYPSIKKTKEVGLNLASDGYQQDIMTACSRAGESVRLGVSIMSSYIQQRLQCLNLCRAYGTLKGMRNEGEYSIAPFSTPTQLFGCPDCLPIFYINTYSSVNEVRLYKYCELARHKIYNLYKLTENYGQALDTNNLLEHNELYVPSYLAKVTGGSIRYIRGKLDVTFEESKAFFENYPEYNIMKPNEPVMLLNWIKSIYYNRSFSKAYTQLSRVSLLLRLSYFVSQKCLNVSWSEQPLAIKDYYESVHKQFKYKQDKDIMNVLTNFNGTVSLLFEMLENSTVDLTEDKPLPATALKIPQPLRSLNFHNSVSHIIQYGISKERFLLDKRCPKRPTLLDQDLSVLEDTLGIKLDRLSGKDLIPLFSILKSQAVGPRYGLGHSTHADKSVIVYISSWLSHGVHPSRYCNFRPSMRVEVKDPFSGEIQYARLSSQYTTLRNIILENLTQLYYFLCVKNNISRSGFRESVSKAYINEPGDLRSMILSESIAEGDLRDLGHKRMAGYFKYLLYGETSDLEKLCLGSLGYRYSFISTTKERRIAEIEELRDRLQIREDVFIEDALYIIYQNSNYTSLKVKGYGIVVIGSVQQLTRFGYVHLISRYLWNEISIGSLQQELDQGLILKIPCSNKESILKHCIKSYYRNGSVHTTNTYNRSEGRLNIEVKSTPFGKRYARSLNSNVEVNLDDKTASACAGGVRLFRLNLNLCGPIYKLNNVTYEICGVSVQSLGERGILFNYLSDSTRTQLDCTGLLKCEHKKRVLGLENLIVGLKAISGGQAGLELNPDRLDFKLNKKIQAGGVMEPDIEYIDELPESALTFKLKSNIKPIQEEVQILNYTAKLPSRVNEPDRLDGPSGNPNACEVNSIRNELAFFKEASRSSSEGNSVIGQIESDKNRDFSGYSGEESDWDSFEPEISVIPEDLLMGLSKTTSIDKTNPLAQKKENEEVTVSLRGCVSPSAEASIEQTDYETESDWSDYEPSVKELGANTLSKLCNTNKGGELVNIVNSPEYRGKEEGSLDGVDETGSDDLSDWEEYEPNVSSIENADLEPAHTSVTFKEAITKPKMNLFSGYIPHVESVRDVIEWGNEMYCVEENLDEEPNSEDCLTSESDDSDELSPEEPFFTEVKSHTQGYYMSHISTLPGIIEYLIRGYTGLSDLVFVGSVKSQWELIKFVVKVNTYMKTEKLPEELEVAMSYVLAYFEDLVRSSKIPQWSTQGRVAWKTEDNCRLRLNFYKRFRTYQAAQAESMKLRGSQIEETNDGWIVLKPFSEDVIRYILDEDPCLSQYIYNRDFKNKVQDLEEMVRSWM